MKLPFVAIKKICYKKTHVGVQIKFALIIWLKKETGNTESWDVVYVAYLQRLPLIVIKLRNMQQNLT